ncbi:MAG: protein kinase [Clostridia bacterium]|nr:protein kinase [Clostridia bacterium]
MSFYCHGKYVSDEEFGENSVIKGIEKVSGEAVAIKRWPAGGKRGGNEAGIWEQCYAHDYLGYWVENGYEYLARKWVKGENLSEYVYSGEIADEKRALELIFKICVSLELFYDKSKKVYCDLKPENIIVTDYGVKLIDFESAQSPDESAGKDGMRSSNTICFASRDYSAPEVYHGVISYASDIYSLGMLLRFMVFGSVNKESVNFKSEAVKAFYEKCTAHRAEDRYADMSEAEDACFEILSEIRTYGKNKVEKDVSAPVIQVENMTVNAGKINYAEEERASSPAEKVVFFPKNRRGYRRMVLYIPENPAFAAELAYVLSKKYNMRTAVFDVSSYVSDSFLYYLPIKADIDETFMVADGERSCFGIRCDWFDCLPDEWIDDGMLYRCFDNPELYVSACNVLDELELENVEIRDFVVWCYSHFDITLLYDRAHTDVFQQAELMRYSDYVIIPTETDADTVCYKKAFYSSFMENYSVPLPKLRFVGWDYCDKESADHEAVVTSLGEHRYLGTIEKDSDRRTRKNINGSYYCKDSVSRLTGQYGFIIENLIFEGKKTA